MAKKKGFYSTTPVVPAKRMAGGNPMPGPSIGTRQTPTIINALPATINSMVAMPHGYGKLKRNFPHGYGHDVRHRTGALRLSGHSGAHRVGKK